MPRSLCACGSITHHHETDGGDDRPVMHCRLFAGHGAIACVLARFLREQLRLIDAAGRTQVARWVIRQLALRTLLAARRASFVLVLAIHAGNAIGGALRAVATRVALATAEPGAHESIVHGITESSGVARSRALLGT